MRYAGMLAGRAGRARETFTLPAGSVLSDLIGSVWQQHPTLKALADVHDGGLASMIRWLVNSRTVAADTPLSTGDEITLLPGAGGG